MRDASELPYEYTVFGRPVRSSVRLPALRERPASRPPTGEEIRIDRGTLPRRPAAAAASTAPVYEDPQGEFVVHATPDRRTFVWFYDGLGTLRVRDGTAVTLSPAPSSSDAACRRLVRGPGLRGALVQQGAVVLHASAVVVDGEAVAFAGPSGRGKSTTAAAFVAAGHDLLTGDILPCPATPDGELPSVPPGYPSLSVETDAARAVGVHRETDELGDIRVEHRFSTQPRPLSTVYLLADGDSVRIEELESQTAVFELLGASYAIYDDTDRAAQRRHLDACGSLASSVSVCRLTRPRSLAKLDDVVAAVETDVTQR